MIIMLNDDLRIEIDGDFQLQKRGVVQKQGPTEGNEVWKTLGYYSTINQLTHGLLNKHIGLLLPGNVTDIRMLAMVIEEVGFEVSEKLKDVKLSKKLADVT